MSKRIRKNTRKGISILLTILILILHTSESRAESEQVLYKGHATAYCLPGVTASGQQVRHGICAMHDKELLGKTVIIYKRLPDDSIGNAIGIYEVLDTGCKKNVVDVWCEDLEECQEFMNEVYEDGCQGRIWIQIVKAEG